MIFVNNLRQKLPKRPRTSNNSQPTLGKTIKKTPTLCGITWVDGLDIAVLQLQSRNQLNRSNYKPRARESPHQICHEEIIT